MLEPPSVLRRCHSNGPRIRLWRALPLAFFALSWSWSKLVSQAIPELWEADIRFGRSVGLTGLTIVPFLGVPQRFTHRKLGI
jgi:hypothetical protein